MSDIIPIRQKYIFLLEIKNIVQYKTISLSYICAFGIYIYDCS